MIHSSPLKCGWCLSIDHTLAHCPARAMLSVVRQFEAEQRETATAERMIGHRTYAGQLEKIIADHGLTIPPSVSVLNPDHRFPPYTPT